MEGNGCCKGQSTDTSCTTEKTGSCGDKTVGACGTGPGDTKGKCCPVALLKGGLAGGIIIFAWFAFSWQVLPWHMKMANLPVASVLVEYFLFCVVAGLLLTKILKKRTAGCCPVAAAFVVGLLVAIFNYVPSLIWQHSPSQLTLVGMADDLIAITLAGAAIGRCVLKAGSCGPKDKDAAGSCGTKTGSCS